MNLIKVKIARDNESHRQALEAKSSRVLTFPDGVSRVVVMTDKSWESFDWVKSRNWTEESILRLIYNNAIEGYTPARGDFETYLRGTLEDRMADLVACELVGAETIALF
jgi:hypothetical protein